MTIKAIKEKYKRYRGQHNSFAVCEFWGIGKCVIVVSVSKNKYIGDYVEQVVRVSDGCELLEDGACRPCDNIHEDAIEVASEMLPGTFIVRCYTRIGDLDHEVETDSLIEAEVIRMTWAAQQGITKFAYMPTIWAEFDGRRYRLPNF